MRAAKNTGVKGYQTVLDSLITVQKENGHLCSLENSNARIMSLCIGLMEGNSHSLFLKSGRRKEKKRRRKPSSWFELIRLTCIPARENCISKNGNGLFSQPWF